MGLRVTSEPAVEPITLDQAKDHLRVDSTADDDLITALIKSARRSCEIETNRSLITQTLQLTMVNWRNRVIGMPRSRVQSITSVKYIDSSGTQQTIDASNYQSDLTVDPGRLAPVHGYTWPTVKPGTFEAVEITYVAGYGDAGSDVEPGIVQAMYLMLTHLYENRSAVACEGNPVEVPMGASFLLTHHRVPYTM